MVWNKIWYEMNSYKSTCICDIFLGMYMCVYVYTYYKCVSSRSSKVRNFWPTPTTNPYSGHEFQTEVNVFLHLCRNSSQVCATTAPVAYSLLRLLLFSFTLNTLLHYVHTGFKELDATIKSMTSRVAVACVKHVLAQWKIKWYDRRSRYMLNMLMYV